MLIYDRHLSLSVNIDIPHSFIGCLLVSNKDVSLIHLLHFLLMEFSLFKVKFL